MGYSVTVNDWSKAGGGKKMTITHYSATKIKSVNVQETSETN